MIFAFDITTPHNTPESSAIRTVMPLIVGTITKMSVWFPPGANALAHIKFLWGLYQLFPSNEQSNFASGGEAIEWDEAIEFDTEPAQLVAVTWNDDDTYDHTISVRVVIQPPQGKLTSADVAAQIVTSLSSSAGAGVSFQTGPGGGEIFPGGALPPTPAPSPSPSPAPTPSSGSGESGGTVITSQNLPPPKTGPCGPDGEKNLAALQAQFDRLPPFVPNGPVPIGAPWWLRLGFVQNVLPPFHADDAALCRVLVWADPGYSGPPPADNYL